MTKPVESEKFLLEFIYEIYGNNFSLSADFDLLFFVTDGFLTKK